MTKNSSFQPGVPKDVSIKDFTTATKRRMILWLLGACAAVGPNVSNIYIALRKANFVDGAITGLVASVVLISVIDCLDFLKLQVFFKKDTTVDATTKLLILFAVFLAIVFMILSNFYSSSITGHGAYKTIIFYALALAWVSIIEAWIAYETRRWGSNDYG